MRNILAVLVVLLGLAATPLAAHATPVTYNLTLTNSVGNISGGTAFLTVDSTPNNVFALFTEGGAPGSLLSALSFSIGGDTFTLADSVGGANAVFTGGQLSNITYLGTLAAGGKVTIALSANGLSYAFDDELTSLYSFGVIDVDANVPPSATAPEPSTLMLFGTGVLGLAGFGARKLVA
jgi:hypothetical protein